jgi:Leucine-rich repeat (LRR) protein
VHLNLAENRLAQVPEVVFKLASLQSLDLSFNRVSGLLRGLTKLTALRSLHLVGTGALELPEDLRGLEALDEVYLSCQGLLPSGLSTAPNLRSLKLFGPVEFGVLMGFSRLELLDASYTELAELPASIGALASLERLYLHGNVFSHVPDSIARLHHLKSLTLGGVPQAEVERVKALLPWCSVQE